MDWLDGFDFSSWFPSDMSAADTMNYAVDATALPQYAEDYSGFGGFLDDMSAADFYGPSSDFNQYAYIGGDYAYPRQEEVIYGPPAELAQQGQGGNLWDEILGGAKKQFMANPLSWGAAGLGGIASYLSAKKAAKGQKKLSAEEMARRRMMQQRADQAYATKMQYDAPQHLQMTRQVIAAPRAQGGEAAFFTGNALPRYFAEGGDVDGGCACGGLSRYVKGGSAGQADKIPAMLSDGEYVVDADVVAALGDGNNEAGAAKLDQMRQNVRKHKRSASPSKIPPKAKAPEAYLKGAK